METPLTGPKSSWKDFHGPNLGYVIEQFERFLNDPDSVDPELAIYFNEWGAPADNVSSTENVKLSEAALSMNQLNKVIAALKLADNIRIYGHRAAKIYPLKNRKRDDEIMEPSFVGLTEQDLVSIPAFILCPDAPPSVKNGLDAINHLRNVYTNSIAFEFAQVHDFREKLWLRQKVESGQLQLALTSGKKRDVLKRLTEVEEFEKFLHRTYVGQKRFSIEGLDVLVPMLDEIIAESVVAGAETINIAMAHRGRLNVLAHVLGKPYAMIFSEFQHAPNKDLVPSEGSVGINYGWTGDVKYHLGLDRQIESENMVKARVTLANNPSHLEFVGAVVEGFTRASQDNRTKPGYPETNSKSALPILIHGDAAFPGQGIVAETLNLSRLTGYQTGGTVHIIANNTIGFTTEFSDSRSTKYASDLAKGYEMPILHVNADDPDACLAAARFVHEYRATFHKDVLIDLVGYRRFGHNEMDEPMTTNPQLYKLIQEHPTVRTIYAEQLLTEGIIDSSEKDQLDKEVLQNLQAALDQVPKEKSASGDEMEPPQLVEEGIPQIETGVALENLTLINGSLLSWPDNFKVFGKLARILQRRADAFEGKGKIDWGHAETLAYASIISDGTPIRLTGQDSERGTFAQRNIVLHDQETGETFSPLHTLPMAKASFAVHNSPLSEGSVLGFEYGYNVFAPETLVLWEAQFGDFANAAQVMFDQFISSSRAKWGQTSGLVMLLPHGYEGQGPEHSSARLERFLTLAAENNWTVANLTSAAQYFHILRRQAAILTREEVRPLVLMSPKSLLRHPLVASTPDELASGSFKAVLEQSGLGQHHEEVERLVLGSGKIMIDLAEQIAQNPDLDWLHIVRVEEIYPFPFKELHEIVDRYPNLKEIAWIQEEPKNMGAWTFVEPRIEELVSKKIPVHYIGRRRRSSTAEGDPIAHKYKQNRIITTALSRTEIGGE